MLLAFDQKERLHRKLPELQVANQRFSHCLCHSSIIIEGNELFPMSALGPINDVFCGTFTRKGLLD